MTSPKLHLCARCGIAVHKPGVACADCCLTDPKLVALWRMK